MAPARKWRTIILTTVALVPSFWAILAGLIAAAEGSTGGPQPGAAIAFGLALLPFVFVLAAFLSQHPRAPGAALRAMGMSLLVGIPASAIAGDAVTGLVAGVGAGGAVAFRRDGVENLRARAIAVAFASVYVFVLVRTAGAITVVSAPAFPFTAIGVADLLSIRRAERLQTEQDLPLGERAESG